MAKVRITEVYQEITKSNPVSGHRWTEKGKLLGYEIYGPTGLLSTHKKPEMAELARKEWEEFFTKYPVQPVVSDRERAKVKRLML